MKSSSSSRIFFHYIGPRFYFPRRTYLKNFLVNLLKKEGKKIESINFIFCDDAFLLQINKEYLNHNYLTDVITFELSPKGQPLLADIFISIERVKENALEFNTSFRKELLRVMFHGLLHLCGYKDKSASETKLMRQKESFYINKMFPRETSNPKH